MEFVFKKQEIIVPSPPSPPHVVTLSIIDQILPPAYTQFIYFYAAPNSCTPQPSSSALTHSLARALAAFPPVAGRLKPRSCGTGVDVECHNQGVVFVEAHATATLHQVLHTGINGGGMYQPSPLWNSLAPDPYADASTDKPLLYTQLTRLACGATVVAVLIQHQVADGAAQDLFVASWAELARGEPSITARPHLNRDCMQARVPPSPSFHHPEYIVHESLPPAIIIGAAASLPPVASRIFEFTQREIGLLKKRAGETHGFTGFQVLAAHIWKHVSLARGGESSQHVKLLWPIDGRKRFTPPLPAHYFGNALFYGLAEGTAVDVMDDAPLRIQRATQRFTDEYMRSAMDLIAAQASPALVIENLGMIRTESSLVHTELCVTSWVHFRAYEVDWGWGSPLFFSSAGFVPDGFVILLPCSSGQGVNAMVFLFQPHMDALLADAAFFPLH